MGAAILQGDPPIELVLRRSARARRITLRVSRNSGQVTLTLPPFVAEAEALRFARQKEDWLRGHLANHVAPVPVGYGASLPVLGQPRRIAPASGRRVVLQDDALQVPGPPEQVGKRVQAWLKTLARRELAFASDAYAAELGLPYTRLTLRDTRSRWGSCTSQGRLMYSWRLIMAPAEVLSYVAAHEVAHLREMNHSAAFWALVEKLYGDYRAPRRWLRQEGHHLHGIHF